MKKKKKVTSVIAALSQQPAMTSAGLKHKIGGTAKIVSLYNLIETAKQEPIQV